MMNEIIDYVKVQLDANQFLQGGVILGLLTSVFMQLKGVPVKIWTRIQRYIQYEIVIEEAQSRRLYTFMERWLQENKKNDYRRLKAKLYYIDEDEVGGAAGDGVSGADGNYVSEASYEELENYGNDRPNALTGEEVSGKFVNKNTRLALEQANDYFYLWHKYRAVRVTQNRDRLEHAQSTGDLYNESFILTTWFGRKQLNKLLEVVTNWGEEIEEKKKDTSTAIYKATFGGDTDYLHDLDIKEINNVIIDGKDELIADIDKFNDDKAWYKARSIPYKRGYLFYGLPGNGKTTLAISLAKKYGKDIIVGNLSNMSDEGVEKLFTRRLTGNSILLLEDVDAMFSGKRSIDSDIKNSGDKGMLTKVNFSTLLNCLDGVFSKEGVMVIMTTNHPEKLDPALIRKGRVDFKFLVSNPSLESVNVYVSNFFESEVDLSDGDIKRVSQLPMVTIQNVCIEHKDDADKAITELKEKI